MWVWAFVREDEVEPLSKEPTVDRNLPTEKLRNFLYYVYVYSVYCVFVFTVYLYSRELTLSCIVVCVFTVSFLGNERGF